MALLDRPPEGRSWLQRWTTIGAILFGAAVGAESSGLMPTGTAELTQTVWDEIANVVQGVGQLLMFLGVYRHVAN